LKKRSSTQVEAETSGAISVARNANFNRLWGSQILSQVAQNLLNFALIISVFQLAQGTRLANAAVALLILSFGIPSIFFAAAAGVYVDHWNKKHVLVIVNFLRAALVLSFLVLDQNLWLVLLVTFLISTTTQFFAPAEAAAIPSLVTKHQLLRANSLFVFTLYASFIVGYSLSAPTIALFGSSGPYVVTSIMFVLAGVLCWFLPDLHTKQSAGMPLARIARFTLREINNNWKLIRTTHNLAFPIAQLTIGQTLLAVIMALAPALSIALLGLPIQHSSHYLIIPAGLGLIVGVIVVDWLTKRYTKFQVVTVGMIAAAVALTALGLSNQLHLNLGAISGAIVASLVFILGFMNAVVSVSAQTILQESTTDASRGKVFGALGMMINIAATLPVFFAGLLADFAGVTQVIAALGAALLTFAVFQFLWLRRLGKLTADA
jgi:predicted MFS family arabinose efflux permease